MFDKEKFAQILKRINDTYNNQRDFAKHSNINRTYLSQYMNMKLDEPPKPIILERLANNSNGLIDYNKLMEICGYIDDDYFLKLQHLIYHLNYKLFADQLNLLQLCIQIPFYLLLSLQINHDFSFLLPNMNS